MLRLVPRFGSLLLALAALPSLALAQRVDTVVRRDSIQRLPPTVTVTRDRERSSLDLPYAISTMRPDSLRPGQRHTQLDETLFLLPGVTVANRNNPAQDARVSIRGFGARSAFGVRSIRVMRDGMPLTLPDGQTPVDYLDLESVGRVEVIRGSASALYGNAGGGVIDLRTAPPPQAPLAMQARGWGGSYGLQRWVGVFGGSFPNGGYQGNVGYTTNDGYREYSHQRTTNGYARALYDLRGTALELQFMGVNTPTAQNPGALTLAQFDSAPQMADPQSILKHARKKVSQFQLGLSARRPIGDGDVTAQVYGGSRNLFNPLTFATVGVERFAWGGGARGTLPVRLFGFEQRLSIGADAQRLNDHRRNWANCNGVSTATSNCPTGSLEQDKGVTTIDQNELVSSVGPYVRDELTIGPRVDASVGVRADWVRFEVQDHLITSTDPDNSGARTMSAVSPMLGVVARVASLHAVYANIASAFETPTTTELGNQPDGSAGLNRSLHPQYSTTYETGLKGVALQRVQYDVSLFDTEVRDELIPFEADNGRTFYRNAGKTRRYGAELEAMTTVGPVDVAASYAYSHFRFTRFRSPIDSVTFADYAGNTIPGIPMHQVQASVTYRWKSAFVTGEELVKSSAFVDDANTARARGYAITNLRLGGTALFGRPWFAPVLGVQNLFDTRYVGSIAINAARGKFYEPAPGRVWFAGLTLAVGR